MPNFRELARDVDQTMLTVEQATLDTFLGWFMPLEERLQREVRRIAREAGGNATQAQAFRMARAQALAAQLRTITDQMQVVADSPIPSAFMELQRRSYEGGISTAQRTLTAYNAELPANMLLSTFGPAVDLDRLTSLATASVERLSRHAPEVVESILTVVQEGLSRGSGVGKMTRDVQQVTDLFRYQAERIVRTESMSTSDDARRATFTRNDVEFVQRVAVNDARVCPFCLYRDGMVYRLADRPTAVLHPNDRCVLVPWRRDWPEDVRGDEEHAERRREALRAAQATDPDFKPNDGPTYWERQAGQQPPAPVWTPGGL